MKYNNLQLANCFLKQKYNKIEQDLHIYKKIKKGSQIGYGKLISK